MSEAKLAATAPGADGAEEDIEEVPLQDRDLPVSLLDAILDRQEADGTVQRYSRLVVVARIADPGSRKTVGPRHQELLAKAAQNPEGEDFSVGGLGLIQAQSFVSFVEAPPDVCTAYLRLIKGDVYDEEKDDEPENWSLEEVRVVAQVEDCPFPCFGTWAFREVQLAREQDVDLEQEGFTEASFSLMTKLSQLGKQLTEKGGSASDMESALDHLKQYYTEYLPSNERVIAFTEQDAIFSLDEFLQFHADPIDITLASDHAWPMPKPVSY